MLVHAISSDKETSAGRSYSDRPMELGLATFADVAPGASPAHVAKRLEELLEEIELADRLGLEVFGVGEHHRRDYAVSAPTVALAAAAARTERIRLSSAVTVLGSADPVTVFEEFSTLDLLSGGRAEIMAGRGSFTESFPLFGYDLDDYDDLFAEKLELLLALRDSESVTWYGRHRAALHDASVYPRPLQQPLPVWIAVGGTPGSVARAGMLEPAAHDRHHRRRARTLCSPGRALPRGGEARGRGRVAAGGRHQLAHVHRRHRPAEPRTSSSGLTRR